MDDDDADYMQGSEDEVGLIFQETIPWISTFDRTTVSIIRMEMTPTSQVVPM